jgi:hypothetical protein
MAEQGMADARIDVPAQTLSDDCCRHRRARALSAGQSGLGAHSWLCRLELRSIVLARSENLSGALKIKCFSFRTEMSIVALEVTALTLKRGSLAVVNGSTRAAISL